jgi:hypothetical protein
MSNITKNTAIENFQRGIINRRTREKYVRSLNEFMRYVKILDYEVLGGEDYSTITEQLKNWILYLNEKGLNNGSIDTKLKAVEIFLEMNERTWARSLIRKLLKDGSETLGLNSPLKDRPEEDFSVREEIDENNFDSFFPMICDECGKSFGKDVVKLAVHSSSHYPPRVSKQLPTRYVHRNQF